MLGFKLDRSATKEAYASKRFLDKRSIVDMKGRDHLKGVDVEPFRRKIFERSQGLCEAGGCYTTFTWDTMEMHHQPAGYERYDSMESCFALCRECHRRKHVQVRISYIKGI